MYFLQSLVFTALMAFPVVFFIIPKTGNGIFYTLLLCSLYGIAKRFQPMGKNFTQLFMEYWPINIAMLGMVFAVMAQQLIDTNYRFKSYDTPSRLGSFAFLLWIFLLIPSKSIKNIQWSLIAGSVACAIVIFIGTSAGASRPSHVLGFPLIPFGNIAMMVGILAFVSIGWNTEKEKLIIFLKIVACALALYGSYLSQTRGGWLALPLFIVIATTVFHIRIFLHKIFLVLVAVAILSSTYFTNDRIEQRVDQVGTDIVQFLEHGNKNTSVGIRLQLWQGAWIIFKENPLLGVGKDGYDNAVKDLAKRQLVTPEAAVHPHSHNDILFHMATLGLFGFIAILSIYFVPAFYFFKHIKNSKQEIKTICGMGLALTLGFLVFGLTDSMFYWRVSYTFYVIVLAVLFAFLAGNLTNDRQ